MPDINIYDGNCYTSLKELLLLRLRLLLEDAITTGAVVAHLKLHDGRDTVKKQESRGCSPSLSGGSALKEREGTRSLDISLYRSEFEVSHSKCTQAYHTDIKHNLTPTDEFLPPTNYF